MDLKTLAGNPRLRRTLEDRRGGLPHACLISGPVGSGRHTLARLLAAAMVCQEKREELRPCRTCNACKKVFGGIHPDVSVITGPEAGKPITVNQVRELRADAYIRPNESLRKVYLLENAGDMRAEAQNAMLKLLEEGPEHAAFLLLSENPGAVLQTIRSRCEQLPLTPVSLPECRDYLRACFPDRTGEELEQAALACQGILGRAVELLEGGHEEAHALERQARDLAEVLTAADELTVLETVLPLEKAKREEWEALLPALERSLVDRLAHGIGDGKRTLRCVALVRELKEAAALNTNPGQLSGWLCAGVFE